MTITTPTDPAILERLLALIGEALALADSEHLHATGIALDTARLSIEDALVEARAVRGDGRRGGDRSHPEWRDPA